MTDQLAQLIAQVVTLLLVALVGYAVKVLHTHVKSPQVNHWLDELDAHAGTGVGAAVQTIVLPAMQSAKDGAPIGRVAQQTLDTARTQAVAYVLGALTKSAADGLSDAHGMGLRGAVESTVDAKLSTAVSQALSFGSLLPTTP